MPLTEFTYNYIVNFSIQEVPFFTNYNYHPWFDIFDFLKFINSIEKNLINHLLELHTIKKGTIKKKSRIIID